MQPKISEIAPEETFNIRHQVMWPNRPIDYIKLSNDNQGKHYGLFINGQLISVISLFIENQQAQFRKFATLNEHQGKGFGSQLLQHVFFLAEQQQFKRIWCNARTDKSSFYTKFGMKETDNTFKKGGIDYVIMEKTFD
ncbi:GNAT family N-acetyltransferase [Reichenbachiella sp.]|uniref:GNAT family N-acetyltransferase n=1 Tax=Reichenbachiella sp. TaxID=2184521 RepID=UPI003B5929AB